MRSYVPSVTYGRGFPKPAHLEIDGDPIAVIDKTTGELMLPSDDPMVVRQWIVNVTQRLLSMPGATDESDVKHTLLDGIYMRELFIPKGFFLVGKVHRQACINVVSKGDVSVLTETGSARVKAGYSVVSPAGIQKVGYAHEDSIFVNIFRTDETDPKKIEQAIAYESYEALPHAKRDALCQ